MTKTSSAEIAAMIKLGFDADFLVKSFTLDELLTYCVCHQNTEKFNQIEEMNRNITFKGKDYYATLALLLNR